VLPGLELPPPRILGVLRTPCFRRRSRLVFIFCTQSTPYNALVS